MLTTRINCLAPCCTSSIPFSHTVTSRNIRWLFKFRVFSSNSAIINKQINLYCQKPHRHASKFLLPPRAIHIRRAVHKGTNKNSATLRRKPPHARWSFRLISHWAFWIKPHWDINRNDMFWDPPIPVSVNSPWGFNRDKTVMVARSKYSRSKCSLIIFFEK